MLATILEEIPKGITRGILEGISVEIAFRVSQAFLEEFEEDFTTKKSPAIILGIPIGILQCFLQGIIVVLCIPAIIAGIPAKISSGIRFLNFR